jgi:hypothetical protein
MQPANKVLVLLLRDLLAACDLVDTQADTALVRYDGSWYRVYPVQHEIARYQFTKDDALSVLRDVLDG